MEAAQRSIALDAMRGLTLAAMILVNTPGSWGHVYAPLAHADWHGYTPTDLVFPFFLFIVGAAMYFALRRFDYAPSTEALLKLGRRVAIIFAIGLLLHAFPFASPLGELRIMGVLQRIALAYGLATLAVFYLPGRWLYVAMAATLLGYWALLYAVGAPDAFSVQGNVVAVVDRAVLGDSHLWAGKGVPFDPEGLLSTWPATVNVLAGFVGTRWMMRMDGSGRQSRNLLVAGAVLVVAGHAWGLWLPINKSLWTGSFVVVSSGWALVVLAAFVALCSSRRGAGLAQPLRVYGMNPLFIYALSVLWVKCYWLVGLEFDGEAMDAYDYLYRASLMLVGEPHLASVLFAGAHVLLFWLVAWILYRRNIFIRI